MTRVANIFQVQFKRKPVKFEPLPSFLDDSTEVTRPPINLIKNRILNIFGQVFHIEATGEVFIDYEKYLARSVIPKLKIITRYANIMDRHEFYSQVSP